MKNGAWITMALLLSAGVSAAQVPPPLPPPPPQLPQSAGAPRDRVAPPKTGTGVLKGRVVDGVTGTPIPRVRVRITSATPRASVYTDATGAFTFAQLPVATYGITAEKSTYLPGRYPEAGKTMRSFSMPLALRESQVMDDVVVRMYHGGAIAGRVVDAQGDPVENAGVRVLKIPPGGRGKPQMRNSAQTNDLGEFRVARLEPGSYLLSVMPQRMPADDPSVDAAPPPQPVATYFPNAMAIDQAAPLVIERGQTLGGIEIALNEAAPVFVSGTVLGSDGQPVSGGGSVNARSASREISGFVETVGGQGLRPDGTFRMQLPPGDYTIEAQVTPPQTAPGAGPVAVSAMNMPSMAMFGSARVTVGGGNVEGLTIAVGRGATASGRIVFDGTSEIPANKGDVQMTLFQQDGISCRGSRTQVAADWTFKIEGLMGTCTAMTPGLGGRWMLKAITADDEDLLKAPHTFESGQTLRNLQLVFTDRRTELKLRVADDTGQTTDEYVALVFPVVDKGNWTAASTQVRTLVPRPPALTAMLMSVSPQGARNPSMPAMPPQDRIAGLRPGEYFAIAVDDMESELTRDPFVLERLAASATRLTLGDGASNEVPLRRLRLADAMRER